MESQKQRRPVQRGRKQKQPSKRADVGSRQICLPLTQEQYDDIWNDPAEVRKLVDQVIIRSPELFPAKINEGYQLSGKLPPSKKMPNIQLRHLRVAGQAYYLRPSFVMPSFTGTTDELRIPMELIAHGTALWIIVKVFGRNEMFWLRQKQRLGRNSIVGTTVKDPSKLPLHLAADEHHAKWRGEKGFIATTAAQDCLLGVALTDKANDKALAEAYGVFHAEATAVNQDYNPKTVNTDGWFSTQNAFKSMFPAIITILCFLHGFLKIRDRGRKEFELHERVWEIYHSETAEMFDERMSSFRGWFESKEKEWSKPVKEMTAKLFKRSDQYRESLHHPGCYRTSNQVDRLMNRMTRLMYSGRGIHGNHVASELRLRGWALMRNFVPYAHRSGETRKYSSPANKLNEHSYPDNWLENLQISASMNGTSGT